MKKLLKSLPFYALTILSTFGCGNTDTKGGEETTGKADLALTGTDGTLSYCVTGMINLTGTAGAGNFNLPVVGCDPTPITYALPAGVYNVGFTLSPGVSTGLPATTAGCQVLSGLASDQMLVSCSFLPSQTPLVVAVGATSQMALAFQFLLNDQQAPTIVFGVGAGEFTLAPGATVVPVCGSVLATAVQCAADASCLSLNDVSGNSAACYENCDFVEGVPLQDDCASATAVCTPVLPLTGMPPALVVGGLIGDLDDVPGACVEPPPMGGAGGMAGAGGAGGAGAGAGGSAGT